MQSDDLTDKYNVELEQFLQRLKTEINHTVPSWPDGNTKWLEIDDYICQLNTFYYQSFDQHFMPAYMQQIQLSVKEALNLSRTQSMVKKDIIAIIRRYAGLYNKVKTISDLLSDSRRQIETSKVMAERNQGMLALQLSDSLEQLLQNLHLMQKLVVPVRQLWENTDYTRALASSALCREAIRVWNRIEADNLQMVNEADGLYQSFCLMAAWSYELSCSTASEDGLILHNLKELVNKLAGIRNPALKSWIDDSLKMSLNWNIELIAVHLQHGQATQAAAAARSLHQWLSPLVIVLKQHQLLISENIRLGQNFCDTEITSEALADLEQKLTESQQTVEKLRTNLASLPAGDYDQLLDDLYELLQYDYEYFHSLNRNWAGMFTNNLLNQICLKTFLIIAGLESGRTYRNASLRLSNYYQELLDWMEKYQNFLKDVSSDLERLLAPRNLTRIWKGMDIRIEHIGLKVGEQFPSEYNHLLERHHVETKLSDRDRNILHAEGDLFIIRVDDLAEEEMPYLIIGLKGKTNASGN